MGSSLGWEDFLGQKTAAHPSILAWEVPWTQEPSGLQPMVHKELDMAEHKHTHTYATTLDSVIFKCTWDAYEEDKLYARP